MTTLAEMVEAVYRDLADEGTPHVFSTLQVEDFIRGGIAELNRVAPTDTTESLVLVTDVDTGEIIQFAYNTAIQQPYRVEIVRLADGFASPIEESQPGQTSASGYVFRQTETGGIIEFFPAMLQMIDPVLYGIRLHGYATRPLPYTIEGEESPVLPVSQENEYSVRSYAKSAGFDLLSHDRSLFQQWQGQTNNTDVSPTQMLNMAQSAKADWNKTRGLIRTVRRWW